MCVLYQIAEGLPGTRAVAVQWVRGSGGVIAVEDVCDFGTLPVSAQARASFASVEEGALPPVAAERWVTRRFVPVPADHPHLPQTNNEREYVLAIADYVGGLCGRAAVGALYAGARPTFRIDGARMQESLITGVPPVKDFVLDLGYIYSAVLQTVTSKQLKAVAADDTRIRGGAV
jgi:hypothetical protein